ncbi:MAG: TatD family hydrolase [Candidatus Omnitrophica bacterium]|nr:TatD family hydrolase [Candidatus Omnitrophota bacterium]
MPIIDTHAHIDQIENWPEALERAKQAGVSDIVAVSLDLDSMRKILELSQDVRGVRIHPAFGVHPEMIKNGLPSKEVFDFIRSHIKEAVAIGETGLDFWYKSVKDNQEEKDKQRSSFTKHLELAKEFDLPIIIHSRGAWGDCLDMTKQMGVTKALFHWYSGPLDVLQGILEAGYYVSTSPSVAYSPQSQQAMLAADVYHIVLETDSPVTYRDEHGSFKSEPKDVVRTLKALSCLKNIDEEQLLNIVNKNAKDLFRI